MMILSYSWMSVLEGNQFILCTCQSKKSRSGSQHLSCSLEWYSLSLGPMSCDLPPQWVLNSWDFCVHKTNILGVLFLAKQKDPLPNPEYENGAFSPLPVKICWSLDLHRTSSCLLVFAVVAVVLLFCLLVLAKGV